MHRSGKIRILVAGNSKRLESAPDIPTNIDAGFPELVTVNFIGVFAPGATPRPIIDKLASVTQAITTDKEYQQRLIAAGFEPLVGMGPAETAKFVQEEHARWTPLLQARRASSSTDRPRSQTVITVDGAGRRSYDAPLRKEAVIFMAMTNARQAEVNEKIHAQLVKAGVKLTASLPDDWVNNLITRVEKGNEIRNVRVGREAETIAVCAGAFFGGVRSAAIFGNTGLLTCTGEMATLCLRHMIPVFCIVSAAARSTTTRSIRRCRAAAPFRCCRPTTIPTRSSTRTRRSTTSRTPMNGTGCRSGRSCCS